MNFGHGELGFGAWPSAKSKPVAEYCTVFSVSTPIAFDALAMTVRASCAEGAAADQYHGDDHSESASTVPDHRAPPFGREL